MRSFFAIANVLRCHCFLQLRCCSAARTQCRLAGTAPGFAAGWTRRLAGGIGEVETVIADEAGTTQAPGTTGWRRRAAAYPPPPPRTARSPRLPTPRPHPAHMCPAGEYPRRHT